MVGGAGVGFVEDFADDAGIWCGFGRDGEMVAMAQSALAAPFSSS